MGLLDKIKELVGGKKNEVKSGIDKGSDMVQDRVGPKHADKVDSGADQAKDAVDKLPE